MEHGRKGCVPCMANPKALPESSRSSHDRSPFCCQKKAVLLSYAILGSTLREQSRLFQAIAIHDTPVYMALDHDAEKKAEWIIKSLLKYDLEVFKIPIDEADVGEMGGEEFKERLLSARQIKNEMYFFEQMLENI